VTNGGKEKLVIDKFEGDHIDFNPDLIGQSKEMKKDEWMQAQKHKIHEVKFGNLQRLIQTRHKSKSQELPNSRLIKLFNPYVDIQAEEDKKKAAVVPVLKKYGAHSPISFTMLSKGKKFFNYHI